LFHFPLGRDASLPRRFSKIRMHALVREPNERSDTILQPVADAPPVPISGYPGATAAVTKLLPKTSGATEISVTIEEPAGEFIENESARSSRLPRIETISVPDASSTLYRSKPPTMDGAVARSVFVGSARLKPNSIVQVKTLISETRTEIPFSYDFPPPDR
jgi:hypothetical protein